MQNEWTLAWEWTLEKSFPIDLDKIKVEEGQLEYDEASFIRFYQSDWLDNIIAPP